MQLIFNFRKGFAPLKEGLEACGCSLFDNLWEPSEAQLKETDACIINFYEGVRRTWRLKTKLKQHDISYKDHKHEFLKPEKSLLACSYFKKI